MIIEFFYFKKQKNKYQLLESDVVSAFNREELKAGSICVCANKVTNTLVSVQKKTKNNLWVHIEEQSMPKEIQAWCLVAGKPMK